MDILLNELSLNGQFSSIDNFIEEGLPPIQSILKVVDRSKDLLLKKREFYASLVTPKTTLHEILVGTHSRTYDQIRRAKRQLSALMDNPYWEDSAKQTMNDSYVYLHSNISGSSIAEACERDKVIISFTCSEYSSKELDIVKNEENIIIDNLFDNGHYDNLLKNRGIVIPFSLKNSIRFSKTSSINQGQIVYKEFNTNRFWCLDNLHKNHYEVFDSTNNHIGTADLDGNIDTSKKVKGRKL